MKHNTHGNMKGKSCIVGLIHGYVTKKGTNTMSPKGKPPLFYFMCMIHIKCALLVSMFEFLRKIDSTSFKKSFFKIIF
jgi:hypothetical protein